MRDGEIKCREKSKKETGRYLDRYLETMNKKGIVQNEQEERHIVAAIVKYKGILWEDNS